MVDSAFEACTIQLSRLLTQGTRRCLASTEQPALLFSGGLDSSILAVLLSSIRPTSGPLIVAGSNTARDIQAARQAATALGLPLETRRFTLVEVAEALPSILTTIGNTDVLQVSLAIPLYFAASRAHELGVKVLLSGQGADELFGGYARYERLVLQGEVQSVDAEMRTDFRKLIQTTLPYQQAIVERHAIHLVTPYLDGPVIAFAQNLPLHYKILRTDHAIVRKRILRNLAVNLKLPATIADAPKRAAQYGSGAARMLAELTSSYWHQWEPGLSAQESCTQARIRQFLVALKEEELCTEGKT
jgi:asparagine synthase (glutamine-hydrolysing)